MMNNTSSRSWYERELDKRLERRLYRSGLHNECNPEQTHAGPNGHQSFERSAMDAAEPNVTSKSSGGHLAWIRQRKLAVQEALLKKRQELDDMQARIQQDYKDASKRLQMEFAMGYANLRLRDGNEAGNSIKTGEEQEEEIKQDELQDRVRRYEVGNAKANPTETISVDLGNLFEATSESGAGVEDTAGNSGSDRALEGFSRKYVDAELTKEVRVEEPPLPTGFVSDCKLVSPTKVQSLEILNSANHISKNLFTNDAACQITSMHYNEDFCGFVQAKSCAKLSRQEEDSGGLMSSRTEGKLWWKQRDREMQKSSGQQLPRSVPETQADGHDKRLPPKPPCQPLHSDAKPESGEETLLDSTRASVPLFVSTFTDILFRCRYPGAETMVAWRECWKGKPKAHTDVHERSSCLLKEPRWMVRRVPALQFGQLDTLALYGATLQNLYNRLETSSSETRRCYRKFGTIRWRYTDETSRIEFDTSILRKSSFDGRKTRLSQTWERMLQRSTREEEVASFYRVHSLEKALETHEREKLLRAQWCYGRNSICFEVLTTLFELIGETVSSAPMEAVENAIEERIVTRTTGFIINEDNPRQHNRKLLFEFKERKFGVGKKRHIMSSAESRSSNLPQVSMARRVGMWLSGKEPLEIGSPVGAAIKHRRMAERVAVRRIRAHRTCFTGRGMMEIERFRSSWSSKLATAVLTHRIQIFAEQRRVRELRRGGLFGIGKSGAVSKHGSERWTRCGNVTGALWYEACKPEPEASDQLNGSGYVETPRASYFPSPEDPSFE